MHRTETRPDRNPASPRFLRLALGGVILACLVHPAAPIAVAQEAEAGNDTLQPQGERRPTADQPPGAIPKAYQVDRYLDVWKNSPFQREATPIAKATTNYLSRDYAVYGFISFGDNPVVTLINKKTRETTRLTPESEEEIQLVEVIRGKTPRDLVVTVSKDGQTANLTFDKTFLNAPPKLAQVSPNNARIQKSPPGRNMLGSQKNQIARPNGAGGVQSPAGGTIHARSAPPQSAPSKPMPPPQQQQQPDISDPASYNGDLAPSPASRRKVVMPKMK